VTLESFDWRGPRHVRRHRPEIGLAWLTRLETVHDAAVWWDGAAPVNGNAAVPSIVAAEGGQIWAPAFGTITAAAIDEAHKLGLRVFPWTVNRRSVMRRLIAWGVDGLITDRPDVAMAEVGG
jgi:glycerophosphoryl diester phosphodiesterase